MRESEERHRLLFAHIADAAFSTDMEYNIGSWNPAAERMYGWKASEVIGKPAGEILRPQYISRPLEQVVQTLLETGEWREEVIHHRRDGTPFPVLASAAQIKNETGKAIGYVAINHDLTERKRAEAMLTESEQRLQMVLEAAECGSFDYDFLTGSLNWSERQKHIWGLAPDEKPTYAGTLARVHPEDQERIKQLAAAVTAPTSSGIYETEYRIVWPDGSIHWNSVNGRVFFEGEGKNRKPVRWLGVERDLTAHKQTEEAARATASLLEQTFASLDEAVFVVQASDRCVVKCNEAATRMFGYLKSEMIGRNTEFLHENETAYQEFGCRLFRALEATGVFRCEYSVKRKDGSVFLSEHTVTEILDDSSRRTLLVSVVRDITERKQVEEALASDLKAMSRLQKLASVFVENNNLAAALTEVVDAAISIAEADFGNIQLLDPATGDFRIVAQQGFPPWWCEYWDCAGRGLGAYGTGLERGERVIVEDVEGSPIFGRGRALDMQRKAGVRAVQSTPLVSRSGKIVGIVSTHYKTLRRPDDRALRLLDLLGRQTADLIENTQAQAALRESEQRFAAVIRNSPVAIGISRLGDGTFLEVNEAFVQLYGYTREEIVGHTSEQLGLWQLGNRDGVVRNLREERGRQVVEMQARRKDGQIRCLLASIDRIELDGESCIVGFLADITERKRTEAERAEAVARLAVIQEEERLRISRELHDQTAQLLVSLSVELKNLETTLNAGRPHGPQMRWLRQTVDDLQQQVRQVAWDLRAGESRQGRWAGALREYVEEWSERAQVSVDWECRGLDGPPLPELAGTTVYRVVQEALTNVERHAQAQHVSVMVERTQGMLRLTVEDDGRGFDTQANQATLEAGHRLGLVGMKERVLLAGGTLLIETSPESGTTILVRIPVPTEGKP